MALNKFVMPKLAMGMNEGTLNEWLFKEGEFVEVGTQIASMETEKVAYDLEAPESGFYKMAIEAGTTVPIETPIAYYADSAEELENVGNDSGAEATNAEPRAPEKQVPAVAANANTVPAAAPHTNASGSTRIIASPLAKKMAKDEELDLAVISGSGPGGRIVKRDILKAIEQGVGKAQRLQVVEGLLEKARIPVSGSRQAIANAMMDKTNNTATLTQWNEADVTDLLAARKRLSTQEELLGTKVSVNAFFIKAIAWAAKKVPIVNSSLQGDEIVIYDNVNVAVALALPSGDGYTENLMVPVIKNVDRLSLVDIDLEMKRLIELGREGKLGMAEMADSTITFSTTAGIAPNGTFGNSILNGSNNTIIGIGGAKQKPAEYQGEIALRQISPVLVNYDHRVVDGAPASRFMNYLYLALQDPTLLLA